MTEANEPDNGPQAPASADAHTPDAHTPDAGAPAGQEAAAPVSQEAAAPVNQQAAGPAAQEAAAPWYPPLPLWKLALLLLLTLGFYSPFFFYRAAKDVRDHGNPSVSPGLYPLSMLIGIAAAIAAGRLAGMARDIAGPERRFAGAQPVLVGMLVLVGFIAWGISDLLPSILFALAGLALFALPWLLLQRQLNLIKADLPETAFRTRPNRYTKLQLAAFVPGSLVCLGLVFVAYQDLVRRSGEELVANSVYTDPQNRFEFTVPRDGWSVVGPNYLGDDSDLELLGPGDSDWAVLYVHELSGWTIDELVESRYRELRELTTSYAEDRRLVGADEIPVSYAKYSGRTMIDGELDYIVTTFALEERAVEMIVFSAGRLRQSSGAEQIALSLRPVARP